MSRIARCIEVLREGPSSAFDVGLELGMPASQVHDCMKRLRDRGVVVSRPFVQMLPHEQPRARLLYELVDYGVQA